jgi:hypothetical protein
VKPVVSVLAGLVAGALAAAPFAGAVLIDQGIWRPAVIVGPSPDTIADRVKEDTRAHWAPTYCWRNGDAASCTVRSDELFLVTVQWDDGWTVDWQTDEPEKLEL